MLGLGNKARAEIAKKLRDAYELIHSGRPALAKTIIQQLIEELERK